MASTLASGNWQRVWVCLWTKDWALPVCFPTISIWWSAEMMAMWAVALANGNSMHLLSVVEKGTRSVPAVAVSSSADKLSSGIKGLTFSLAAYWLVLKSLTPLSNGPRLILKCLSLLREVLGPVFKGLMLLAPEAASLVPAHLAWTLTPEEFTMPWTFLEAPSTSQSSFSFLLSSSSSDLRLSLLWASFSSWENGERGSLWYKLGHAGPCEGEVGYAVHSGALSWGFDHRLLGLQLKFRLNINISLSAHEAAGG